MRKPEYWVVWKWDGQWAWESAHKSQRAAEVDAAKLDAFWPDKHYVIKVTFLDRKKEKP